MNAKPSLFSRLAALVITGLTLTLMIYGFMTIPAVTVFLVAFPVLSTYAYMYVRMTRHYHGETCHITGNESNQAREYVQIATEVLQLAGHPAAPLHLMKSSNSALPAMDVHYDKRRRILLVSKEAYNANPVAFRALVATTAFYEKSPASTSGSTRMVWGTLLVAALRLGYVAMFGLSGLPLLDAILLVGVTYSISLGIDWARAQFVLRLVEIADDRALATIGADYAVGLGVIVSSTSTANTLGQRMRAVHEERLERILAKSS